MNVTEVNIDSFNSPSVTIERENIDAPVDSGQQLNDGIEDLDLLVDPNKSRASPNPIQQTENSMEIPDVSLKVDSPPTIVKKEEDDLDFKINAIRSEDKSSSQPLNFNSGFSIPTPSRISINDGPERQELLFKLKRLESRGIPLSKHYSSSSSLDEMKEEYSRLKNQRDLENSIKFQRKTMMAFASGVEFLNTKFDPFDIKLEGWSESLHENLNDYDDVFEELHEKYKAKTKIAPELKLLMMLGGSAVMFHMTNNLFKSASPQMEDILKNNPDLARQFASAAVSESTQNNPGLGHVLDDMLNHSNPAHPTFIPPQPSFVPDAPPPPDSQEMSGPKDQDVERILNQIKEFREEPSPVVSIPEPEKISPDSTREVKINAEIPVKKRRGRPPKNRPATSSFALNI
tara:strand:+ start:11332 stop:12537 length:1206 start_codon:yes stop_codon:yes gene_type:complete